MVQGRQSRLGVNGVGVCCALFRGNLSFTSSFWSHTKQLIQKFHKSAAMGISGGIV